MTCPRFLKHRGSSNWASDPHKSRLITHSQGRYFSFNPVPRSNDSVLAVLQGKFTFCSLLDWELSCLHLLLVCSHCVGPGFLSGLLYCTKHSNRELQFTRVFGLAATLRAKADCKLTFPLGYWFHCFYIENCLLSCQLIAFGKILSIFIQLWSYFHWDIC